MNSSLKLGTLLWNFKICKDHAFIVCKPQGNQHGPNLVKFKTITLSGLGQVTVKKLVSKVLENQILVKDGD